MSFFYAGGGKYQILFVCLITCIFIQSGLFWTFEKRYLTSYNITYKSLIIKDLCSILLSTLLFFICNMILNKIKVYNYLLPLLTTLLVTWLFDYKYYKKKGLEASQLTISTSISKIPLIIIFIFYITLFVR